MIEEVHLHNWRSFNGYHKLNIDSTDAFLAIIGPNGAGKSNLVDSFTFLAGDLGAAEQKTQPKQHTATGIVNKGIKLSRELSGACQINGHPIAQSEFIRIIQDNIGLATAPTQADFIGILSDPFKFLEYLESIRFPPDINLPPAVDSAIFSDAMRQIEDASGNMIESRRQYQKLQRDLQSLRESRVLLTRRNDLVNALHDQRVRLAIREVLVLTKRVGSEKSVNDRSHSDILLCKSALESYEEIIDANTISLFQHRQELQQLTRLAESTTSQLELAKDKVEYAEKALKDVERDYSILHTELEGSEALIDLMTENISFLNMEIEASKQKLEFKDYSTREEGHTDMGSQNLESVLTSAIGKLENSISEIEADITQARQDIFNKSTAANALSNSLKHQETDFSPFFGAYAHVLDRSNHTTLKEELRSLKSIIPGVRGLVRDYIKTDDPDQQRLLLRIAGDSADMIIVDTDEAAMACLEELRRRKHGGMVITFLVQSSVPQIRRQSITPECKQRFNPMCWAVDLIHAPNDMIRRVIDFALRGTLIVPSSGIIPILRNEFEVESPICTPDGSIFNKDSVIGIEGVDREPQDVASQDSIEELPSLVRIEAELSRLLEDIHNLEEFMEELEEKKLRGQIYLRLMNRSANCSMLYKGEHRHGSTISRRLTNSERVLSLAKRKHEMSELRTEKAKEETRLKLMREKSRVLESDLAEAAQTLETASQELELLDIDETMRDIDTIRAIITQEEDSISRFQHKFSEDQAKLEAFELERYTQYVENSRNRELLEIAVAKMNAFQSHPEYAKIAHEESQNAELGLGSVNDYQLRVSELEAAIANIDVAPDVIREYEYTRKLFVSSRNDLNSKRMELAYAEAHMSPLRERRKARTMQIMHLLEPLLQEAYGAIALSGPTKESISLRLLDEDYIERGVQCFIHPRGKQYVEAPDLSGGELAAVILALTIAVHMLRRTRILVLDEPDAHLDQAACKAFVRYINAKSSRSHRMDVIVVSHQPSVYNRAGILVGIYPTPTTSQAVTKRVRSPLH